MLTTPSRDIIPTQETADVELSGRRFPAQWLEPKKKDPSRLRQLAPLSNQEQLPMLVAKEVRSRLSWAQLPPDIVQVQPLAEAYVASLNRLAQFRQDVDNLMRIACEANLEFRQELGETHATARDAAMTSELHDMLQQATSDWFPPRNILDAQLASRPVPEVRRRLEQSLVNSVADFTQRFFALLARLVDKELFGLVEWYPNNCCAYHFFKRVLIQENKGTSRRITESYFDQITERDRATGRQIIGKKTTRITHGKGQHTRRFARHQHDVTNAIRTSIGNTRVVMPPPVVRLCDAVPDWLKPFVEVIDGTIIRERIVERDVQITHWEDVEVTDEPIIGCEPGVIIGPYVLTGWGPREVEAELLRRKNSTRQERTANQIAVASYRWPVALGAAAILAVVSFTMMLRGITGVANGSAMLAVSALAVMSAWQGTLDFATTRRIPMAVLWANLLTFSLGCQFAVVLWLIARWHYALHWVTPLTLVAFAISTQVFLSCSPAFTRK